MQRTLDRTAGVLGIIRYAAAATAINWPREQNKSLLVAFTSWRREFLTLQIDPGIQMVGQLQADGRRLLLQAFNHLHTASVTWFMASR